MCSLIIYGNSLNNGFVFDDELVIVNNDFIKDFKNLPKLVGTDYLRYSGELTYRPLVTLSYFLDYKIWGNEPFGFHLTSLILHILNIISVYFLTNLIVKNRIVSLISALFFCLHSVHTEVVNCIAFREDILCSLFFLLSLLFYIEFDRKGNIAAYILSVGSFILSLLSKEMGFTLPLAIVLYLIYRKANLNHVKKRARFYVGYLLITITFLYLRFFVIFNPIERTVSYPGGSFYTNILNMLRVVAYYIKLLIIPYPLCPMYVFKESTTFLDMRVLGALIVLILALVVLFYLFRRSRIFLFAGGWFFVTLIPVYNIIPIEHFVAERYLYIPSFGFCIFASSLLLVIDSKRLKKGFTLGVISLMLLYSFFTVRRNFDWRTNLSLYGNTVINFPHNYHIRYNLGNEYLRLDKIKDAIREYEMVIKDKPDYGGAHFNLGWIYANSKDYKKAEEHWLQGLRIDPENKDIISNLKTLYKNYPSLKPPEK